MRYIIIFYIVLCAAIDMNAQQKKVLFIGNSYTYFWNLPQLVQALSYVSGDSILTQQSTAGGVNLGQHWNSQKGLESHKAISDKNWDYVVLQDHSLRAIRQPDSLEHYIKKWVIQSETEGSKPILYSTWARAFDPTMTDPIASAYRTIGQNLDIAVAPVGQIWAKARELRPELPLYDEDQSHPAPLGTYLTALTFYSIITGQQTKGLPNRLQSKDMYGEPLYLLIVSADDAQFCQSIVDNFLISYNND